MSTTAKDQTDSPIGETTRSIISLLLVIHFSILFVFLSGSIVGDYRSKLQEKLLGLFNAYGQPLSLEVSNSSYYYHLGSPFNHDHLIEVTITNQQNENETFLLGSKDDPFFFHDDRIRRYATIMISYASYEDDTTVAEMSKRVGGLILKKTNATRAVVRLITHAPQHKEFLVEDGSQVKDPFDNYYLLEEYAADVWLAADGSVQVLKRSSRSQVAPTEE